MKKTLLSLCAALAVAFTFTFAITVATATADAAPRTRRKPRPGTVITLPQTVVKGRAAAPQVVYYIPLSGELRKIVDARWDMFTRPRR